jgi:hypothetical protein
VTRVLAWIGGAVVALVLTGLTVMHNLGPRLDANAKAYVEQSLPIVIAKWNVDDLTAQASPELLEALPADKLAQFYGMCAERLGPLKAVQSVKGESFVHFLAFPWSFAIGGQFVADVQFEKAAAHVSVRTIRRHGEWRYTYLFVNSDAFLPGGKSSACRYVVPDAPRPRPVYILDLGAPHTMSAAELVEFCHDKLHLGAERLSALPADGVTEDLERHQLVAEDVIAARSRLIRQQLRRRGIKVPRPTGTRRPRWRELRVSCHRHHSYPASPEQSARHSARPESIGHSRLCHAVGVVAADSGSGPSPRATASRPCLCDEACISPPDGFPPRAMPRPPTGGSTTM